MIPDSPRNRLVTRGFITIVSAVPLLSITFTLFIFLSLHSDTFSTWRIPRRALFVWCLVESLFWGWSGIQSLHGRQVWARVIPSIEERKKLKEDWIRAIDSPGEGAMEFVEGWFTTGKQKARLTEIHLENIKDW
jgi:hypothetical protein